MIQGFFLEEALGERIGLTDGEWAIIGPLLPAERERGCRPAQDNRRYFVGMMWLARTGAQWRHLPDEYGKWNSVFRCYRRWMEIGAFEALLADKGYDADAIRAELEKAEVEAVIPVKRNRKNPASHDAGKYK